MSGKLDGDSLRRTQPVPEVSKEVASSLDTLLDHVVNLEIPGSNNSHGSGDDFIDV